MSFYEQSTYRISELSVDVLWKRVIDIESWPQFTRSITSAHVLGNGQLAIGSQVVINQPGAPEATWTVTEFTDQKSFTYEMRRAGLVSVAHHAVEQTDEGKSVLYLSFSMQGRLAKVWGALMGKKIKEFLQLEVEGLTKS